MKLSHILIAVGVAALATPAAAGDWNNGNGGLKGGQGAAVPVPAPILIPDSKSEWYLRGDVGFGVGKSGNIRGDGLDFGLSSGFGDQTTNGLVKLGFGRYVTPSLRIDFTVDLRARQKIGNDRSKSFQQTEVSTFDCGGCTFTNHSTYQFDRNQSLQSANQTLMTSIYYDIGRWSGFKPYVSGGAGVSFHQTSYRWSEKGSCASAYDTLDGVNYSSTCARDAPTTNGTSKHNGVGIALAAGAGFGYVLSENVTMDVGYRYLWQQQNASLPTSAGLYGQNHVKTEWRTDHEVTTGLRIDID